MFLKSFLILLLVAVCRSDIFCDFKEDLCSWSNIYECHFKHETEKPLAGKTGYLELTQDTCNIAGITVPMKKEEPRFRFHYFINGTGRVNFYVYGVHAFSGRSIVWQCSSNQGPKWNVAEVSIPDSFLNSLQNVIIEVNIIGEATVAIGKIQTPEHERIDHICPPSPPVIIPTTTKKIQTKAITKKPPRTTLGKSSQNHTICNFNVDLCQWRDINHLCHFQHVKDTPLLGETGYLMLSKDTCKRASLLVRLKENDFQLHYLMNGTGKMSLSLGVVYGFSGRDPLWSCSSSQGPQWHKVDIHVKLIHFDPRISVFIEAEIDGDATIAIGNIANAGNGSTEKMCPSAGATPLKMNTARESAEIITKDITEASKRMGDVRPNPKLVLRTNTSKETNSLSISDSKPASIFLRNNEEEQDMQSEDATPKGVAIIGGSILAGILLIVAVSATLLMHLRKLRMWDVNSSAGDEVQMPKPRRSFDNPVYRPS